MAFSRARFIPPPTRGRNTTGRRPSRLQVSEFAGQCALGRSANAGNGRVALVGDSVSGKSTLARLICGLYERWEGEIRFDGQTRQQTPAELMTSSLAFVEQDIFLFAGTIRENLCP